MIVGRVLPAGGGADDGAVDHVDPCFRQPCGEHRLARRIERIGVDEQRFPFGGAQMGQETLDKRFGFRRRDDRNHHVAAGQFRVAGVQHACGHSAGMRACAPPGKRGQHLMTRRRESHRDGACPWRPAR